MVLCRRAIKGSFMFKLAIEVFKIINIILLYEEQFYLHIFILVSGDIATDDFAFLSEVVFSPSCWRHRTELPTAAWLSLPTSAALQENCLCKEARTEGKFWQNTPSITGARLRGWFTEKWVLNMMREIKNVILGPRTSAGGDPAGIRGWPHGSQMTAI